LNGVLAKRRTQAARREEAEGRLVQAALKLLAERGYDGFTMAEVGEAAGYSRGLPAHYFGRKDDLLALVAQHTVESYNAAVARVPAAEPGLPRIAALVRRYVRSGGGPATRALGLLFSKAMIRPSLEPTISRLNDKGLEGIRRELEAGIAAGNIRADANIVAQARLIFSFLRGQLYFAALDPHFEPAAVAEEFIETLGARLGVSGAGVARGAD
jgi:AcrR family transcriptional regulator